VFINISIIFTVNRFVFINISLVFPSYFGKIPMNIASHLFENYSYRIIFILNLNNLVSKSGWIFMVTYSSHIQKQLNSMIHKNTCKI